jgi:transposase
VGVLESFGERLRRSEVESEGVATDMPPSYINAGLTHLPKTTLILDHFYILKLYHDSCLICKKTLSRIYHPASKQGLRGTGWLPLKNPVNLDNLPRELSA